MGRIGNSYIRKSDRNRLKLINQCQYCGNKNCETVIEHIIPLYSGGNSRSFNLTKACVRCNSRKSTFSIDEFLNRNKIKQELYYYRSILYVNKLRKNKNIDRNRVIELLIRARKEHSYHCAVIGSIIRKEYIIYG